MEWCEYKGDWYQHSQQELSHESKQSKQTTVEKIFNNDIKYQYALRQR